MSQKVVIIADPGIDTSFALALAFHDPDLEVVGLIATAGNVHVAQATKNVHIIVDQFDPPKWPRVGAALPIEYDVNGLSLHGPGGLGGVEFPSAIPHQQTFGDKLIGELVRANPGELTILVLGPSTVLARAIDYYPDLPSQIQGIVMMGGTWHEPGNSTAVSEFHFFCDPESARTVLRSGAAITLLPLDVTRRLVFSPSDLLELPNPESRTCQFLRKIVPWGIRASSNMYGIEGFHLKDVLGVIALTQPLLLTLRESSVDVETRGELTRGMSVVDARQTPSGRPNVLLATGVDIVGVRDYMERILRRTS